MGGRGLHLVLYGVPYITGNENKEFPVPGGLSAISKSPKLLLVAVRLSVWTGINDSYRPTFLYYLFYIVLCPLHTPSTINYYMYYILQDTPAGKSITIFWGEIFRRVVIDFVLAYEAFHLNLNRGNLGLDLTTPSSMESEWLSFLVQ